MSNELPPPPTEMCDPVLTGSNELHKAIDEYWQGKYPTYAKGRIKRMRFNKNLKGIGFFIYKYERLRYTDVKIPRFHLTRWNRH